jgi:actin-related protein 5
MKSIANLASDSPPAKKRRRGGGNAGDDDNFGANDDDWSVYRSIGTGGGADDDPDDEEEELSKELKSVESQLLLHDPDFSEQNTHDAQSDWTNSLIHAFLRGPRPFDPEDQAQAHQIHLNVERIRIPEVLFEPAMAGLDQAGIVEIASNILLHRIPETTTPPDSLLKDIFLTGGTSLFRGFDDRLRRELTASLPAGSPLHVRSARDPVLDAWRGAARWDGRVQAAVTREEYREMGVEYIKEHGLGNALL